ncbi:hypothetical protein BJ508DRAFT_413468 [Ascobolus immersus RN42]|uniref:(4-O-methyl)-D-glucuronate--lignin esterase n=1 Tax=Ascobolus immersus RN42 TaxID=1160509 RepID=A0A3N4ICR4_ASCIM|nr:hypothetical protein BJ508DRAFT_413468 [Ascobolus immersus RN42]
MKLSILFVAAALGLATAQQCPALPSNVNLVAIPKLPDPFTALDGSKITTKDQWTCRKEEISQLMQRYELGTFPGKPSSVTGSFSGNRLTINVSEAGKSISFSVTINKPSGNGPFPAIIAYGAASIPVPSGVATIVYNNDEIGQQQGQSSRGRGKFYDIYGSGHSAGALTAWAWGVSRIIDALESSTGHNIDPKRIGVTGCSRNGKGAIVAGALEQRVALSLPQESGSGGSACWRLSDAQKSRGQNVQTASQIISENVWLGPAFNTHVNQVTRLPFDHHFLAAMTAPRGLYVIENTSMEWLGAMSTYGCMTAGQRIYEALGVKGNFGYSQIGGHNHCQFPSSQQSELTAFINRFLLNGSTTPNVFRTDGSSSSLNFNAGEWIPWTTPNLS